MTTTVSGGGGSGAGYPGVTSDNANGLDIQNALTAGNDTAASVPTKHNFSGILFIYGGSAVDIDGGVAVTGITGRNHAGDIVTLDGDSFSQSGTFIRRGVSNGHSWKNAVVTIADESDDTSESSYVLEIIRANNTIIGFDEFGMWASQAYHSSEGIGIFNHSAPSTQVVLATGAGHTSDDVIALLQSYGFCKQA